MNALRQVNAFATRFALPTAVAVGATKNCVCDYAVQKATEERVCWRRNLCFTAFGAIYVGGVQYFIFNRIFPRLIPGLAATRAERTKSAVATAVVLDNGVHIPFLYLPGFYCMREAAYSPPERPAAETIDAALQNYVANVKQDALMQAGVLVPVQIVNFAFMPPHMRVPLVVLGGAVWVSLLSFFRGANAS